MEHPGRSAPGYYEYHILLCPNHGPVAARSRRIWSGQLEIACMVVPEPRISATRAAAAGVKCAAARRATRSWPSVLPSLVGCCSLRGGPRRLTDGEEREGASGGQSIGREVADVDRKSVVSGTRDHLG